VKYPTGPAKKEGGHRDGVLEGRIQRNAAHSSGVVNMTGIAFWVDLGDDTVRLGRQKAVEQMMPPERICFGAANAIPLGPDSGESDEYIFLMCANINKTAVFQRRYSGGFSVWRGIVS
jgi:hypothetical protein